MTALKYAVTDSATMLRRNLRHMLRYPSMTLMLASMPVIFLLSGRAPGAGTAARRR